MSRSGHQVSQNCDNFISERSSTRLHAPPGGGSSVGSLIFGGGEPTAFERRNSRSKVEVPEHTQSYSKQPTDQPPPQQQHPRHPQFTSNSSYGSSSPAVPKQLSSNSYANGSNQNTGNMLTDRRITRIHAPPGGASSFRLG